MKKLCTFLSLILVTLGWSQSDSTKTPSAWKHNLVAGLNVTQATFSDWASGGESALAYAIVVNGQSVQDLPSTNWSNSYKFSYGQARIGSKALRKTDDKIELESVFTYKVETYVNPYAAATLKTQADVGYKYDDAAGTQTLLSRFWAPAYMTQSVGVGYTPTPQFKTRVGAALREVRSRAGYIEKSLTEGGIESITDIEWSLAENIMYKGKLELFSAFNNVDLWIIQSDNTIAAKVSNIISVTLNVQFINNANIQPRTQIKEVLALGIVYTFI